MEQSEGWKGAVNYQSIEYKNTFRGVLWKCNGRIQLILEDMPEMQ